MPRVIDSIIRLVSLVNTMLQKPAEVRKIYYNILILITFNFVNFFVTRKIVNKDDVEIVLTDSLFLLQGTSRSPVAIVTASSFVKQTMEHFGVQFSSTKVSHAVLYTLTTEFVNEIKSSYALLCSSRFMYEKFYGGKKKNCTFRLLWIYLSGFTSFF